MLTQKLFMKRIDSIDMRSLACWGKLVVVLTAALLLVSPGEVLAKKKDQQDEEWSEWAALGKGYVGRKKAPKKPKQAEKSVVTTAALAISTSAEADPLPATPPGGKDNGAWAYTQAEGLYSVAIDDLAAANLGKNVKDLRKKAGEGKLVVTNAGDPVSWYFDSEADEVLFAGVTYDTFHTSTNAYHIDVAGKKDEKLKQPMTETGDEPTSSFGYERAFMDTLKLEEELDWHYFTWAPRSEPDADYWYWGFVAAGYGALTRPLSVPDPAPGGTLHIKVTMRGATELGDGNDHRVIATLGGQLIGTEWEWEWDGFDEIVLEGDINHDDLIPDLLGNFVLEIESYSPIGESSLQLLDQVEVSYPRLPVAVDGQLWLHDVDPGTQVVSGFGSDDLFVIESPKGKSVLRRDARIDPGFLGGFMVTFDSEGGTDFLVVERESMNTAQVEPDKLFKLTDKKNKAEYLVISPWNFGGTALALAEYRENRYGHVGIVWLKEIYDEFSDGRVDPYAITRFMDTAIAKWDVPPEIVALIGKGTVDHKNRMLYDDSFLPILMTDTPWSLTASDDRLLGGNGDVPVSFGRIPIIDDLEGIDYVNKVISYESSTPGEELYSALLIADNPDDGGEFHDNSDALACRLTGGPDCGAGLGFTEVTKLYHPIHAAHTALTEKVFEQPLADPPVYWNPAWETGYVSYDGHGSPYRLANENLFQNFEAKDLRNKTQPIFTALTCTVGDFTVPGVRALATNLVLNPEGGAIASLSPTGLSLDIDAQILNDAFVDSLFGSGNTIGDAVKEAKLYTQGLTFPFMQRMYAVVGDPAVYAR